MSDILIILIAVSAITGLIYMIYMLLNQSGSTQSTNPEDLQITTKGILEQVQVLYEQKKYGIAEKLALNYLAKNPKYDELRTVLCKIYIELNKVYEAMQHALLILKHNPINHEIRMFLASCYMRVNQGEKAISELKEVLKFDKDNVIAMKQLAKIYLELNEKQSAIKTYKKLCDYVIGNVELIKTKETIALLYLDLTEYSNAISEFKDILKIYPDDIFARKNLVQLYKAVGKEKKAIEVSEDLLLTNNDRKEELWILGNLVFLYLQINDFEKALEYANRAVENPLSDKITLKEKIAEIYVLMGKTEESIEILKELALLNKDNLEVKVNLAKTYQIKKDYPEAVEMYKEILEESQPSEIPNIKREISNLYASWAMDYYEEEKTKECFKTFNIAFSYDAENPKVYYKLGLVNQLIMNFNEAIAQYQKAIELEPDNSTYYLALADCYKLIDNTYEEKKSLIEALRYDEKNPITHFRLGELAFAQHDNANALASFNRAIELNPEYINAKHQLALLYEAQGERDKAKILYEEILETNPENEEVANNLKMLNNP